LHDRQRAGRRWGADAVTAPSSAPPMTTLDALDRFSRSVLAAAGADEASADAATRAMLHGSRLGVDSHGIRLLDHYISVLEGGRVNKRPAPSFTRTFAGFGRLDADDG